MRSPIRFRPNLAPLLTALTGVTLGLGALTAACGGGHDAAACTDQEAQGQEAEALRVCAPGATVKGVDVSFYQGQVDWSAAKKTGIVFGFARVSDGLTHPDDQFTRNWQVMKMDGIVRGAYQFFRPAEDPTQQADLFLANLKTAGAIEPGDLPAVLDVEVSDGVSNATLQANVKTWLAYMEKATGRKPIVYTAQFMSAAVGTGFGAYPLWVANYGVTCPSLPDGWSGWKFWQSASTGTVSGISGQVDVDEFNGTLADLLKFAGADADAGGAPGIMDAGAPSPAPSPDAGATPGALDAGTVSPRGDAGATIGSGTPHPPAATDAGGPCALAR